jgi:hypothetical protein
MNEKTGRNLTSEKEPEERQCDEEILIDESDGRKLAKVFEAPELAAEVERAVAQVRHILNKKKQE